jgi:tetratricopeptide (TPR) repeat protein
MGLVRRVQGRWAEAQAEWEAAIAIDRNNNFAIRQLGQTLLILQGDPEAAKPFFEKAIQLDPNVRSVSSLTLI